MIHYTYNDHAYCTYNNEPRLRKSKEDVFDYTVGKISRKPKSFKEECINSARLIQDLMTEPITLLYSGGYDSEIMVESFRLAEIPFKTAFCKFEHNYNEHEFKYVKDYCDAYGIKIDIVPLDLIKFWENDAFSYAELIGCLTPQYVVGPWLMDQLDGCLIAATGDIEFRLQDDNVWRYTIEEGGDVSWGNFAEIRNREIIASFPEYTPEQLAAGLPLFKDYTDHKMPGSNNTMCYKPEIYKSEFDLQPRPKYSGFERVEDISAIIRAEFRRELQEMYHGVVEWTYQEYYEGKLNAHKRI